jgi:hypothetical protein
MKSNQGLADTVRSSIAASSVVWPEDNDLLASLKQAGITPFFVAFLSFFTNYLYIHLVQGYTLACINYRACMSLVITDLLYHFDLYAIQEARFRFFASMMHVNTRVEATKFTS